MSTPLSLGHLPSLWKQHLLSEFAGLKQACPEGVFVSMNPGDAALWSAVLFVRDGPYATAVLRFHISFPDSYPTTPPLVTFQTDMFHPLITPLTTHMYAMELQMEPDKEMLPPGGFSLRHGFPEWYSRDKHNNGNTQNQNQAAPAAAERSGQSTPTRRSQQPAELPRYMQTDRRSISTYSILKYIRSTFDKEDVLDSVPLSATGNPGAWHAWRTHRRKQGKVFRDDRAAVATATVTATATATASAAAGAVPTPTLPTPTQGGDASGVKEGEDGQQREQLPEPESEQQQGQKDEQLQQQSEPQSRSEPQEEIQQQQQRQQDQQQQPAAEEPKTDETVRRPEDWNWEGVWEDRVKKGITVTLSESVLYGAAGGPESLIHFLALENDDILTVKENLRRTLGMPV